MSRPIYIFAIVIFAITTKQYYYVIASSSSSPFNDSGNGVGNAVIQQQSNNSRNSPTKSSPSPSPTQSPIHNDRIATSGQQQQRPYPTPPTQPSILGNHYELFEHEIYNPSTDSWTSRQFNISPVRDFSIVTSPLHPSNVVSPKGTVFDGEWKIGMSGAGDTRDRFGWEYYYVGSGGGGGSQSHHDGSGSTGGWVAHDGLGGGHNGHSGLGMRRRKWLRSLKVILTYELYEHELYDPSTDSWASRRFTQSPVAGGGGRDSVSLDPLTCDAPRGTTFDGEWKIDMSSVGETRDGFGWEYYMGRYDGLGRRRRRWLRTLKRVVVINNNLNLKTKQSARSSAMKRKEVSNTVSKKKGAKKSSVPQPSTIKTKKSYHNTLIEQYTFKGFGWNFYKSLVFKKSFGLAFKIPLSANLGFYNNHLSWPLLSSSTYLGYPFMGATFLNASLPLEVVRWMLGGVIYKFMWGLAVMSAIVRATVEGMVWVVMSPWRVWMAWVQMVGLVMRSLSNMLPFMKSEEKMARSLMDIVGEEDVGDGADMESVKTSGDLKEATKMKKKNSSESEEENIIDGFIEISSSTSCSGSSNPSQSKEDGEHPTSALSTTTAVTASPRGGATSSSSNGSASSFKRKYLTILGNQIPPFHRPTPIQYSSTIMERIGICCSWRVSQERGYEYRWNFWYCYLPNVIFWGQLEEEARRRIGGVRRRLPFLGGKKVGDMGNDKEEGNKDEISKDGSSKDLSNGPSSSKSKPSSLYSFLHEHNAGFGISGGSPIPYYPYFSGNLILSLNQFYYAWLLKYLRSILNPTSIIAPSSPSSTKGSASSLKKVGHTGSSSFKVDSLSTMRKNSTLENDSDVESETGDAGHHSVAVHSAAP